MSKVPCLNMEFESHGGEYARRKEIVVEGRKGLLELLI